MKRSCFVGKVKVLCCDQQWHARALCKYQAKAWAATLDPALQVEGRQPCMCVSMQVYVVIMHCPLLLCTNHQYAPFTSSLQVVLHVLSAASKAASLCWKTLRHACHATQNMEQSMTTNCYSMLYVLQVSQATRKIGSNLFLAHPCSFGIHAFSW